MNIFPKGNICGQRYSYDLLRGSHNKEYTVNEKRIRISTILGSHHTYRRGYSLYQKHLYGRTIRANKPSV